MPQTKPCQSPTTWKGKWSKGMRQNRCVFNVRTQRSRTIAEMVASPFQNPSEAFRHACPAGSTWDSQSAPLDSLLVLRNASEQFRNNKGRTTGKTMYYAITESKANQQDSQLPMNSGTRGRRFESAQACHSFNHLRACRHPQEPHCGDFCGDPGPVSYSPNTCSMLYRSSFRTASRLCSGVGCT